MNILFMEKNKNNFFELFFNTFTDTFERNQRKFKVLY